MAEGDLDKVGQHHLKNMHIMGVKTERADAPWSCQQTPSKKVKSKRKENFFLVAVAAEPVQGGRAHGEN